MFSLTTLALALSLGSSPGFAESGSGLGASATTSAPEVSSLLGDGDAADKRRSGGTRSSGGSRGGGSRGGGSKGGGSHGGGSKGGGSSGGGSKGGGSSGGGSSGGSSENGGSRGGNSSDNSSESGRSTERSGQSSQTPASPSEGPTQTIQGVQKPTSGGGQTERTSESSSRESNYSSRAPEGAARSPGTIQTGSPIGDSTGASSRTEVRTRSVNTSSGHQTSGGASSARRPDKSHASPNYRGGNSRNGSGNHAASRPVSARHSPGVRQKAAVHHAAGFRQQAYASHRAAWTARRGGPAHWYSPWRVGYPQHWYHGVFVYGPSYIDGGYGAGYGDGEASEARVPKRQVDRAGKFSLGLRGASYLSGFQSGGSYGDSGLGIAARYRPIDAFGVEVQWTYHDATWSQATARIQQPLSVSGELFAFPWSRVNPYVLGGLTFTDRNLNQPLVGGTFQTEDSLWGPHAGVGLEFGLGKSASLNLDARFIGYVNKGIDDPARAGAVQANAGLNFYF